MEDLQKEVNRSWRTERNLSRPYPIPVSHRHYGVDDSGFQNYLHVAKSKFLFSWIREKLACDTISNQGRVERVWMSDNLMPQFSGSRRILTSSYLEGDKEILLAIAEG